MCRIGKKLLGLTENLLYGTDVFSFVFFGLWAVYKLIPEGKELLKLILNATGLTGAAAILGIFYNKTKKELEQPRMNAKSENIPEETKAALECLKKGPAQEFLNDFAESFKKQIEANSMPEDAIQFSDYKHAVSDRKEKAFVLNHGELIKDGYIRECLKMLSEAEVSFAYSFFPGNLLRVSNPILTMNYPFLDPAAENKVCLDIYECGNKTRQYGDKTFTIYGYALIYAYYNTTMIVSCWELFQRSPDDLEHLKAYMSSKNQQAQ